MHRARWSISIRNEEWGMINFSSFFWNFWLSVWPTVFIGVWTMQDLNPEPLPLRYIYVKIFSIVNSFEWDFADGGDSFCHCPEQLFSRAWDWKAQVKLALFFWKCGWLKKKSVQHVLLLFCLAIIFHLASLACFEASWSAKSKAMGNVSYGAPEASELMLSSQSFVYWLF